MTGKSVNSPILILCGPTASGKTEIAYQIAQQLPIEVVSADSRQIYKGMDIGTAKPSPEILHHIPHHFIDEITPDQTWSAGQFANKGREIIPKILKKGRHPLVVGGSGLYIKALIDGIADIPLTGIKLRDSLKKKLQYEGVEGLYRELLEVDPLSAGKIERKNPRRVMRALEIYYQTGISGEKLKKERTKPIEYDSVWIGLDWKRDALYRRIDKRVEKMLQSGLIDEVKSLLNQGYYKNLNSLQTLGYNEVIRHLEGEIGLDEMVKFIQQNTRKLAKRQLTWFKKEKRITWLPLPGDFISDKSSLVEPDFTPTAALILAEYGRFI